ncbi:MAG: VanZ family protein [Lachnospiraceae bacterium]|nr:VanZ family protein [Lachnospiraceae bacterium]
MENRTKKIIFLAIFILSLAAVWGQSFVSMQDSEAVSDFFVDKIQPLEEIKPDPDSEYITEEYDFLNHLVRKGAHVFEFTVIGAEMMILALTFKRRRYRMLILAMNSCMAGVLIGLIDETIQIFSERGTKVSDVWFDALGTLIGVVAVMVLARIKMKKARANR